FRLLLFGSPLWLMGEGVCIHLLSSDAISTNGSDHVPSSPTDERPVWVEHLHDHYRHGDKCNDLCHDGGAGSSSLDGCYSGNRLNRRGARLHLSNSFFYA